MKSLPFSPNAGLALFPSGCTCHRNLKPGEIWRLNQVFSTAIFRVVSWENHWHKWGLTVEWNIDCFQLILEYPLRNDTLVCQLGFPSPGVPKIAVVFFRFFGRSRENRWLSYPLIQLSNADDLGKGHKISRTLTLRRFGDHFPVKTHDFQCGMVTQRAFQWWRLIFLDGVQAFPTIPI